MVSDKDGASPTRKRSESSEESSPVVVDGFCCVQGCEQPVVGGYELVAKGFTRKASACGPHMPIALERGTRCVPAPLIMASPSPDPV
jgi:hypothetical protein